MSVTVLGFNIPENFRLWKIFAAAKLAGVNATLEALEYNVDNLTKDYLNNVHPLGRAPAIQTDDGYIFESNACLRHIARLEKSGAFLYGRTSYEASSVDMWLDLVATELDCSCDTFIGKFLGAPIAPEVEQKCENTINCVLDGIENWLENRTFLVGERLTIADVNLAFLLDWPFRHSGDHEKFTKKHKNVFRHYNTVMNQPKVIEALQAQGAPIGLPKVEKKKEEPKPKEEKKPKKEEKPAVDDDFEDAPIEEKKKPNPLDQLPPSKFVLDAFKREYSNKDTRKEAAPFLFDNFDSEGFSAYWCKYKYNDELSKAFMTSNLVRGWFQRMDHCRKYAFSCVVVVGEEAKHEIHGFWIFRGKGIPEIVTDVDDTDLYTWTEIPDINKERERITDFLAWDGNSFATTPVLEGRVFK